MSGSGFRLRIRAKLFLILVTLITLSVFVAYFSARAEIERDLQALIAEDLFIRARLVSATASQALPSSPDQGEWDALADRLGDDSRARVTFIAKDGEVLGDSSFPLSALSSLDNHASRPEVAAALRGQTGKSRRVSSTIHADLLYVALPLRRGAEIYGASRVALPLTQVDDALRTLRQSLAVAAALALLVGLIVTSLAVQLASRTALSLTEAAQRMASGDLQVRTRAEGHDEFAELGRALDLLAKSLSSTLDALREERDRMGGILENMEEGVLFLDETGRVALVNPNLREMLVLSADVKGKTLLEAIRHAELRELLDAAKVQRPLEREIHVSGLRPAQILVRAVRLEGAQKGVLAVFVDVTETRRLEGMRREFVANVSHELRTPVTSIRSAGESLHAALAQPEMAKRFTEIIERNAERLQLLVEDLLELSRVDSRQYSPILEPVDLGPFLVQTLSLFSDRATRAKVQLTSEVAPGTPRAFADKRALEHVVTNLVDNALKYAGAGKDVAVTAAAREDRVEILVTDNGPGIAAAHLPRLFERFYRIDAGRSRDLGGTGLGLAIVKNLTESMRGTVTVQSELGKGTSFTVSIPVAPSV